MVADGGGFHGPYFQQKPSTLRPGGEGETSYNQPRLPISPNVRFGRSLADIPRCLRHVRFTPESGTFARAKLMSAKCQ